MESPANPGRFRIEQPVFTVRTHVLSIFKKTGVSKQTELIRRVLKIVPSL